MLVSSILPALADPSNAYNSQHLFVLSSLAQVKSIVLLTDVPDSDKLMMNLFTTFFDILANATKSSTGEQIGKSVEFNMTGILTTMVDESASLPPEVVDVIVAQFLRVDPHLMDGSSKKTKKGAQKEADDNQSTLVSKELPPSYNMAKTICNTCSDRLARNIGQYYTDIIVDSSTAVGERGASKKRRFSEDLDNNDLEISEDGLRELQKAHQLLRELWRACPGVLHNVIPQLEAELSAENVHLRLIATETFGDIISGIGAAGSPLPPVLDSASYPYIALSDPQDSASSQNVLTKPSSPQPFSQAYPQAYSSFLSRSHDKSPAIRAAWTVGMSRVLSTSAGGVGLSQREEERIVQDLARMLADADEKVRIAAVKAVGTFGLRDVVLKLGDIGGVEKSGSVLGTLAERMRDRKHSVRIEAMNVLGRLWGVAVGELLVGDERVIEALGNVPSRIFETYLTNDLDIHSLLDQVLFEHLLPLSFPPSKSKAAKLANGNHQKEQESQATGAGEVDEVNPDRVRVERILLLAKSLGEKAKKVFYALQARQLVLAKVMASYLRCCEEYNAGVMEKNEKEITDHLSKFNDNIARWFSDPAKVSGQLFKFAKWHDRRSYQLIRFCMAPESDYRTVCKAIKELTKRIEQSTSAPPDILSSLVPLLYRVSSLIYNRSHVPSIMEFSRMEDNALTVTANEMLRDISTRTPEVLKAQVQQMCKYLQDEAPDSKKTNDIGALDNLKACASFAKRFNTDIPKDRKFEQAMMSFALHGVPAEAAKHAVTILMTASDKKELVAQDLIRSCVKDFQYEAEGFLPRLAALSQLTLLANEQANEHIDTISEIAIEQVLLQVRGPSAEPSDAYTWSARVDEECQAKSWALKILVNRVRAHNDTESLAEVVSPVYSLLSRLLKDLGELLPSGKTPSTHKSRLRLLAARQCLKLSTVKTTDTLLSPAMFNQLSLVAQDALFGVRSSFLQRLKKYINSSKLPQRFSTIPFLLAFEPIHSFKSDTTTWLRSRTNYLHNIQSEQSSSKAAIIMESVFARLLSLLAHHPDYAADGQYLIDFTPYIIFYLQAVASEENLSLIYHIAQRVKQCRDAISPSSEMDENLYHLSDLAQMTIRKFEDAHNWAIQTQPGKASLPRTLFLEIKDHAEALSIAEKNFLPEGVEEGVEALVRFSLKSAKTQNRKRKSDSTSHEQNGREAKKPKSLPLRKASGNKEKKVQSVTGPKQTPKKSKNRKRDDNAEGGSTPASERRRSGRVRNNGATTFRERDSDEDDEEMMHGVVEWTYTNENDEVENAHGAAAAAATGPAGADKGPNGIQDAADVEPDEWDAPSSPAPTPPKSKKARGLTKKARGGRKKK